ncbi:MAG: 50S ribosomal protein L15 [Chloroflexi bacterium]|nr:MAG: 50S ribosomal protein L15 [Chloroflexota bacterium]PIE80136.1 MAG: 50S ribosomal protein L15 [Chloroflexota bacterium]
MKLHDLRPNAGAKKKRKRVGRGIAAGQGKTAGRGTKGQNARSGGGKGVYFEGGQLPLARRLPYKRGFTNTRKVYYKPVNLKDLATVEFEDGIEVTPEIMAMLGFVKKETDPIVILGEGEISEALTIKAHRFSKSALEKIEAAGGKAEIIPYTK